MPTDQHIAAGLLGRVAYGRVAASVRALPFLAPARHIVADGRVLLRMHKGHGHHLVCAGTVVAYGADNMNCAPEGVERWSVQVVGVCETVEPTAAQLERFGPGPLRVDGGPFEAVYLGIAPRLATVHSMGIARSTTAGTAADSTTNIATDSTTDISMDITAEHSNGHSK